MIHHIQTNLDPGSCWQTAIACVLDIDPSILPDQTNCDLTVKPDPDDETTWRYGPYYIDVVNRYLRKHHGLLYWVDACYKFERMAFEGFHFICGHTVRSAANGTRHIVVAENRKMVWDPHPSQAGLIDAIQYGFLVKFPADVAGMSDLYRKPCMCPECGGIVSTP